MRYNFKTWKPCYSTDQARAASGRFRFRVVNPEYKGGPLCEIERRANGERTYAPAGLARLDQIEAGRF